MMITSEAEVVTLNFKYLYNIHQKVGEMYLQLNESIFFFFQINKKIHFLPVHCFKYYYSLKGPGTRVGMYAKVSQSLADIELQQKNFIKIPCLHYQFFCPNFQCEKQIIIYVYMKIIEKYMHLHNVHHIIMVIQPSTYSLRKILYQTTKSLQTRKRCLPNQAQQVKHRKKVPF